MTFGIILHFRIIIVNKGKVFFQLEAGRINYYIDVEFRIFGSDTVFSNLQKLRTIEMYIWLIDLFVESIAKMRSYTIRY